MNKKLSLSIVIPTKNRNSDLLECVESIISQDVLPEEIVIVDQSNSSGAGKLLKNILSRTSVKLNYLYNPEILSASHARNEGVKRCSGDVILFLDDDVILDRKCIYEIIRTFEEDKEKKIGGVGGLVINLRPAPGLTFLGEVFAKIFYRGPFAFERQLVEFSRKGENQDKVLPTRGLVGCAAYRKNIFKEFSFDENYRGYSPGEDVIFSYSVSQKYDLLLISTAKIYHKLSPRNRASLNRYYKMFIFKWFYFFKKYISKTFLNILAYLWLNVGLIFLFPLAIRGVFWGFWSIIKVLVKKVSLEEELKMVCK